MLISAHLMAVSATLRAGAQHYEVDSQDAEYLKIKSDLENAGLELKRLVKLTNTGLAELFDAEADYLVKVKPPGSSLNIQYFYHGTTAPFEQICDEGLDERLSRSGRFGSGIYFSDYPQKCCKYARQRNNNSYLLRCKVILGDMKEYPPGVEDRSLQKEPLRTVKDGRRVYYDSVKGKPRDHDEYVIYDKRRALIEHVVFYTTTSMSSSGDQHQTLLGDDNQCPSTMPLSGSSSPRSGYSSPANSDNGIDDVVPVVSYEPVQSVNVVRQRTQPWTTQTVASNDSSIMPAATVTMATASTTRSAAAVPTVVPRVGLLTSEVYTSPQSAALRYLINMKGKLPADQLEMLTREYHRTYGSLGSVTGAKSGGASNAPSAEPDPVIEVMSQLIKEFTDVTQCTDVEVCRKYIELGQMDLNRAVEAYIDAMS